MTIDPPSPARPDELNATCRLLAAQLEEHAIPLARELLAEAVRSALADGDKALILLARQGGRPVGVAYLSFQSSLERGGRIGWLEELYVLPEVRGRGTGTALLRAALEAARIKECRSVELEVEASHARAANLYARAGFQPLARIHWAMPLA